MFRTCVNYLMSQTPSLVALSSQLPRKYHTKTSLKSNNYFHGKLQQSSTEKQWDIEKIKKAENLIYGKQKYTEFTPEEKKSVNDYQDFLLSVDSGIILPNTELDLMDREFYLLTSKEKQ